MPFEFKADVIPFVSFHIQISVTRFVLRRRTNELNCFRNDQIVAACREIRTKHYSACYSSMCFCNPFINGDEVETLISQVLCNLHVLVAWKLDGTIILYNANI
ncbi:unnamed protein product [Tenebrio molitor]|nr:unnamed protein product [Tenebrio molitor]